MKNAELRFSLPLLPGKSLVEANAGSGKTTTLVWLYLRLVLEKGLLPAEISFVTFTNKATDELRTRLIKEAKKILQDPVHFSLLSEPEATYLQSLRPHKSFAANLAKLASIEQASLPIGTIHAFCNKLLKDYALDSNIWQIQNLSDSFAGEFEDAFFQEANEFFKLYQQDFSQKKDDCLKFMQFLENLGEVEFDFRSLIDKKPSPDQAPFDPESFLTFTRQVQKTYQKFLEEKGLYSYNSLIQTLADLLTAGKFPLYFQQKPFQALLVDEFQDTDERQISIFEHLFGDKDYQIFVGDPKQALYRFRGADIQAYARVKLKVKQQDSARIFSLSTNYRSNPALVEAVNRLFEGSAFFQSFSMQEQEASFGYQPSIAKKAPVDFRSQDQPLSPFEIHYITLEKAKPVKSDYENSALWLLGVWLLEHLDPANPILIEGKAVEPKDLCILANTNREVDRIKEHLTELRIPLAEPFSNNLDYQQALIDFVSALENPWEERKIGSFLARGWFNAPFHKFSQLKERDRSAYKKLLDVFHACHPFAQEKRWLAAFRHFFAHFDFSLFPLAPQGEDFFAQLEAKLLALQDSEQGEEAPEIVAALAEKKNAGVFVSTVHQAKGLEFPIVLTPYLWSQKSKGLPLIERLRSNDYLTKTDKAWIWKDRAASEALYGPGANYDAYCRLYVSLTRAKFGNVVFLLDSPEKASKPKKIPADQPHKGKNQSFVLFQRKQKEGPSLDLIHSLRALAEQNFSGAETLALLKLPLFKLPLFKLIEQTYQAFEGEKRTYALREKVVLPQASFGREPAADPHAHSSKVLPASRFLVSELLFRLQNEADRKPSIQPARRISFSYTSLSHQATANLEQPAEEELVVFEEPRRETFMANNSITLFPKGLNTGNYVHELLAQFSYDFARAEKIRDEQIKTPKLSSADLFLDQLSLEQRLSCFFPSLNQEHRDQLVKASFDLISALATLALRPNDPNSCLSLLPRPKAEWQFNLFCAAWPPAVLDYIFQQVSLAAPSPNLYKGFLYGALDAIFSGPDFLQIIDWKTDYLGDQPQDYDEKYLAKIAQERGYFLESYLYQYALAAYFTSQGKKKAFLEQHQGLMFLFTRALPFQKGSLLHHDPDFLLLLEKELPDGTSNPA